MHHRLAKAVLGIAALAAMPTATWAQNNPAPQAAAAQDNPYKDQGEVDLAMSAGKETDPKKKIDIIKEWEQKYPDSKLKDTRSQMRAGAVLSQAQALLPVAQAAYGKTGPPEVLDAGQKASQQIVDNFDTYFSDENKTALKATDDQWKAAKHQFDETSHSVLGWIALSKKNYPVAEAEFKKVLAADATAAQISYWLGTSIIGQHNVLRYSEALYDIARSLTVTGATALPAAAQKQYGDYLKTAYTGYHGDATGLEELKAATASSALPPPDFHIKSVEEIEKEKFANEDEFNKAHPDVALWRQVRATLKSDQGDTYFQSIKGSVIPPDTIGFLKGKIVTVGEKDLVVNVDNAGGDVTLKFEKAVNPKAINAGDAIEFKGVAEAYAKEPYMLSLTIDDPKTDIKGLPENAFSSAPARKAPVRKPLPKKKK